MDATDYKLLDLLERNSRSSWAELAEAVGMSAPGVIDRVRRLEESGVIEGYNARLSLAQLGFTLTSFVFLKLVPGITREKFLRLVTERPEFLECHHVTGEYDYLLKVCCRNTAELDMLLVQVLKGSGVVASTETIISLAESQKDMRVAALLAGRPEKPARSKRAATRVRK